MAQIGPVGPRTDQGAQQDLGIPVIRSALPPQLPQAAVLYT